MTDVSQINDRRRFKELWKELLWARMATPLAVSVPVIVAVRVLFTGRFFFIGWGLIALAAASQGIPSGVAKRSGPVGLAAGGLAVLAVLILFGAGALFYLDVVQAHIVAASIGAAVGVAEGIFERSVATIYSGLLGGVLSGILAGALLVVLETRIPFMAEISVCFVTLHLGIGFSLALGRWIRDLPKRKQEQSEPTE